MYRKLVTSSREQIQTTYQPMGRHYRLFCESPGAPEPCIGCHNTILQVPPRVSFALLYSQSGSKASTFLHFKESECMLYRQWKNHPEFSRRSRWLKMEWIQLARNMDWLSVASWMDNLPKWLQQSLAIFPLDFWMRSSRMCTSRICWVFDGKSLSFQNYCLG